MPIGREKDVKHWMKRLAVPALVSAIVLAGFAFQHSPALAYGHKDGPLAQIELSANCNNPAFPLCFPPCDPADTSCEPCQLDGSNAADCGGVGTGGIWFWIEVDTGGTGDISGAGCGHVVGGGGPHSAGAGSLRGDVTWSYSSLKDAPAGVNFFGFFDPNDRYYLVTTPDGEQWLFPVTTGHYSFSPVHGVTLQLQVAP